MSTASRWDVCVHEAGHAVIACVLGYPLVQIVIGAEGERRGVVRFSRPCEDPHVLLAGIVAEERDGGWFARDKIDGLLFDRQGRLVSFGDDGCTELDDDLDDAARAYWATDDQESLYAALDRTSDAVKAAWCRITAVARYLDRHGHVEGEERIRDLIMGGRGRHWYGRTIAALTGQP